MLRAWVRTVSMPTLRAMAISAFERTCWSSSSTSASRGVSIWLHSEGEGRLARTSSRVSGCSACSARTSFGLRSEPKFSRATSGDARVIIFSSCSCGTSSATSSMLTSSATTARNPRATRSSNWATARRTGLRASMALSSVTPPPHPCRRAAWYRDFRLRGGDGSHPFLPLRFPPRSPVEGDDRTLAFIHHAAPSPDQSSQGGGAGRDKIFLGRNGVRHTRKGLRALFSLTGRLADARLLVVPVPVLHGERVTLRPLTEDDVGRLAEIVAAPGVREWWGMPDPPEREREGLRNDGAAFAVEVDGELAGWLGFNQESEPDYRHASLDIALAPPHQNRGLGPEALRTVISWLAEDRGHHRFTIDPALENERAIRAYSKVGFRAVGIMRSAERFADGRWHDSLLMDLLADELR